MIERLEHIEMGRLLNNVKKLQNSMNQQIQKEISTKGKISWKELLEKVDHDEIV